MNDKDKNLVEVRQVQDDLSDIELPPPGNREFFIELEPGTQIDAFAETNFDRLVANPKAVLSANNAKAAYPNYVVYEGKDLEDIFENSSIVRDLIRYQTRRVRSFPALVAADADDIAQDTLFALWKSTAIPNDTKVLPAAYMYVAAYKKLIDFNRRITARRRDVRQQVGLEHDLDQSIEPSHNDSGLDMLVAEQTLEQLQRAIDSLSNTHWTAFTRRNIHLHRYNDIAKVMGVSDNSVRAYVAKATALIKNRLTES